MHRGDGASPAIQKQNGNTISGSDADALPDIVRDQGITFGFPIAQRMCVQNPIWVDLTESNISRRIRSTGTESVCLAHEFLEGIASIDAVNAEPEWTTHNSLTTPVQTIRKLFDQLSAAIAKRGFTRQICAIPVESKP
jgi:hypothetical protein